MGKISQPVISSVDVDLLEVLRIRKAVYVWGVSKRTAGWLTNQWWGTCGKPVLQCSHHLVLADFFAVGSFGLKLF